MSIAHITKRYTNVLFTYFTKLSPQKHNEMPTGYTL